MGKYYNDTKYAGYSGFGKKRKPSPGKRWLLGLCWLFGSLIVLIIGALIWAGIYFNPERLSRIAREELSEYLNADVKVKGLNYKIFSTFPELYISLDSLEIISRSLDGVSPEIKKELPETADILLKTGPIHLGLNVKKLMKKEIDLTDVSVYHPEVNIVMVNDSVTNFNIFPPMKEKMEMPEISIGKVTLEGPVLLNFDDLQKDISVFATLWNFDLKKEAENFDVEFKLSVQGDIAAVPELKSMAPIEAQVSGGLAFEPKPLHIVARSFSIDLEHINLILDLNLSQQDGKFIADALNLKLNVPDIITFLNLIPASVAEMPSQLEHLSGNIPLDVTFNLDKPYALPDSLPSQYAFDILPDFTMGLGINEGEIEYVGGGERLVIDNLDLAAEVKFDSQNLDACYLRIPNLSLYSEGVNVRLQAEADEPFGEEPWIKGNVELDTDLANSLTPLIANTGYRMRGNVVSKNDFSFGIKNLTQGEIEELEIKGNLITKSLNITDKNRELTATLAKTGIDYNAYVPFIGKSGVNRGEISVDYSGGSLSVNTPSGNLIASNVLLQTNLGTDGLAAGVNAGGEIELKIGDFKFDSTQAHMDISGISAVIEGGLLKQPKNISGNFNAVAVNTEDGLIIERVAHTPVWLVPQLPGMMAAIFTMADVNVDFKIDAGKFETPAYLSTVLFSNLDISTNLENIKINSLQASAANSSFALNGDIYGLSGFMASGEASLLKSRLDIDFDNVDIDNISGAYYGAVEKLTGNPYDFTMPPQEGYTAADSLCVVIPRNLESVVNLRSKSAEYMGYRFSPLSTSILLKDGKATLSKLTIGAPYCTVTVDWTYNTSSLDSIGMDLHAEVENFTFSRFFDVFPQLAEKAPEVRNLTGALDVTAEGGFSMFPSMFLEAPSMKGKFNVRGENLKFAREGKIEKITHLMMIKGDTPINITGLDLNASFHDNLLLINPMHLEFDNYQIGIAGVNNLNGEIYYHLALEKSPFHVPFAVNLVGRYDHPDIRFGGVEVKDSRELEIARNLEQKVDINIMTNLHRGWLMFVEEAAKYYLRR